MRTRLENSRGVMMAVMTCLGVVASVGIITVKRFNGSPVVSEVRAVGVENYVECISTNGVDFKSSVGDNWRFNEHSGTYSADHNQSYYPYPGDNCTVHELPIVSYSRETNQQDFQTP